MKARILENDFFGGYFTNSFLLNPINLDLVKNWNLTEVIPESNLLKPYWNGSEWIEGATPEEIAEANKSIVPEKVTAIQFIAQLSFEGISEQNIMAVIDTLNEPDRTVAKVSYNRAVYFERANPFISLIGQAFNKSESDLDDIFINASKIG